jgi:hypothetical protein
MTSPATRPDPLADLPVARLRTPAELAAALPQLCGFVPEDSLVLVSLRGPSLRVGLTMRVDLPPPGAERALASQLAGRLRADRARRVVVAVVTDAPDDDGLPRRRLVTAVERAARKAGVGVAERLLVRNGRWWSYDCADPGCCPPDGTPLAVEPTPALGLVAAQQALEGRAVLPSRDDLVASLAPATDPAVAARLVASDQARLRRTAQEGRVVVGRDALRLWRRALDRALDPTGPEAAAHLVVSLQDVLVRDRVLTWALEHDEALLALLIRLASTSTPPHDVEVCALVGWVAHLRGDGALANVALDRALAGDPAHGLAGLCRQALDGQVAPRAVRSLLQDARAVLESQHPWTAGP